MARKSNKSIALGALQDEVTKKYILKMIGKQLAKEIQVMCSEEVNSVMKSQDPEVLKQFGWDTLLSELSKFAPILKGLLLSATKTRAPRANIDAIVGTCAAILLSNREPKMNLVQKINSLVLYAAHTSKQVRIIITLST